MSRVAVGVGVGAGAGAGAGVGITANVDAVRFALNKGFK